MSNNNIKVTLSSSGPAAASAAAGTSGTITTAPSAIPTTSTAFTGAINLTITNGSINLKPGTSGAQQLSGAMQGTVKASLSAGPGALQKIPIQVPPNLRGQTLNVRLAAPRPATLMAPRAMVIGSSQLRNQNSIVLGSGTLILPSKIGGNQISSTGKVPIRTTAISKALPPRTTGALPVTGGIPITLSGATAGMTFTSLPVSSLPLATQQQLQQQHATLPQSVLVANTTVPTKPVSTTVQSGKLLVTPVVTTSSSASSSSAAGTDKKITATALAVGDKKQDDAGKTEKKMVEKKPAKERKLSQDKKEKTVKQTSNTGEDKQDPDSVGIKLEAVKEGTSIKLTLPHNISIVQKPNEKGIKFVANDKSLSPVGVGLVPEREKKVASPAEMKPTEKKQEKKVMSKKKTMNPAKDNVKTTLSKEKVGSSGEGKVKTSSNTPVKTPAKTPVKTPTKAPVKTLAKKAVEEVAKTPPTAVVELKEVVEIREDDSVMEIIDDEEKPVGRQLSLEEDLTAKVNDPVLECLGADPDTDFSDTLDWHDGIGTLPGSDMKFRKNEFGVLEMIMDDPDNLMCTDSLMLPPEMMEADEHLTQDSMPAIQEQEVAKTDQIKVADKAEQEKKQSEDEEEDGEEDEEDEKERSDDTGEDEEQGEGKEKGEVPDDLRHSSLMRALGGMNKEADGDICRCENCGMYGMASDFCLAGKFCSRSCVGAFATKKGLGGKKGSSVSHEEMCIDPPSTSTPSSSCASSTTSSTAHTSTAVTGTVDTQHTASNPDPDAAARKKKLKRKLSTPTEALMEAKMPKLSHSGDEEEEDGASTCSTESRKIIGSKKRGWTWNGYLDKERAVKMPIKMFKEFQQVPTTKNGFKVGMKLEGIDPLHPSLYCVMTVAEVKGFRVRIHFDGYSECYDFWCNANSPFIFPPGWAERNGKQLQLPKGFTEDSFNWSAYLKSSKSPAAPKNLFTNTSVASVTPHGFRIGMKLEAVDKKNTALTCVATVVDVLGEKILIHFDGWEDIYDYWSDPTSPYIHPVGWCQQTGKPLSPPNDWLDIKGFTWEKYLDYTKSQCVPARAFKTRAPPQCEPGMKLECVDKRNPVMVRVASVQDIDGHAIKIHFDGWSDEYDLMVDDDDYDIHPAGWCARTGHPLMPPPLNYGKAAYANDSGCPTPGCTGVGHIKGAKYSGHHSAFGCPYSQVNMIKEDVMPDRLGSRRQDSECSSTKHMYDYAEELGEEKGICSTPGCDGSGHITGKWTSHYKQSGCPLAEVNKEKPLPAAPQAEPAELAEHLKELNNGKPLFGPGSGRGRKKAKVLKLLQQQEKETQVKGSAENGNRSSSGSFYTGIHQSVFMSSMLPSTPPTPAPSSRDLPLNWEQHAKLLPEVDNHQAEDVLMWSHAQVAHFVSMLPGCTHLARLFEEEQIDGEAFLLMNQADMVKVLNLKLGPALKIYNSILMLKNNVEI